MPSERVVVGGWILSSIVFSTSLILVLKMIGRYVHGKYTTTVTTMHFLATWTLLELFRMSGRIKSVENVKFTRTLILSLLLVGSIILMNFNLVMNSIGFYQVSKLCCIPYTVGFTALFQHVHYTLPELCSLAITLIGVGLFSVSDVEFNWRGSIIAIFAVLCSAHSQMEMSSVQHDYDVDGTSLQLLCAPIEVVLGTIACSSLEFTGDRSFLYYQYTTFDWFLILLSCILSVGVNVSGFGVIGKTSPVTYQVVGHAKTILLLILGYIFFPSKWESTTQMIKAISGICIAFAGVVLYSFVKLHQKAPEPKGEEEDGNV